MYELGGSLKHLSGLTIFKVYKMVRNQSIIICLPLFYGCRIILNMSNEFICGWYLETLCLGDSELLRTLQQS